MTITVAITGANKGIGYEAVKLLAANDEVGHIVLVVREGKAAQAIASLAKETGKPADFFSHVTCDMTDLTSIKKAVDDFPAFDRLVFNAGGFGNLELHEPSGASHTMVINLLGASAMFDLLKNAGKLPDSGRIIFVGSEVARTLASFIPLLPQLPCEYPSPYKEGFGDWALGHSYSGCCVKTCLPIRGQMADYKSSKLIGQMHFSTLARENPSLNIISVSPGAVGGTFATSPHVKPPVRQIMSFSPCFFRCLYVTHACSPKLSTTIGAQRYVDVITGPEVWETGSMPMSGKAGCPCLWGGNGPLVDNRAFLAAFRDEQLQAKISDTVRKYQEAWGAATGVPMAMDRA